MTDKKKTIRMAKNICHITKSPLKRAAGKKLTASIKDNFPPGIAHPALRALANAGYTTFDQLTNVCESDILELHGMGPKAIRILREALKSQRKSFRKR